MAVVVEGKKVNGEFRPAQRPALYPGGWSVRMLSSHFGFVCGGASEAVIENEFNDVNPKIHGFNPIHSPSAFS